MHGKSSKGFDVCVPDIMEYIISHAAVIVINLVKMMVMVIVMVIVIRVEVLLTVALDLYL